MKKKKTIIEILFPLGGMAVKYLDSKISSIKGIDVFLNLSGIFALAIFCIIGIFSKSTDTYSKLFSLFLLAICSKVIFENLKKPKNIKS